MSVTSIADKLTEVLAPALNAILTKCNTSLAAKGVSEADTLYEISDKIDAITDSGGLDTSDATAAASDIVLNKTAYVKGVKVTGALRVSPVQAATPSISVNTATGVVTAQTNQPAGTVAAATKTQTLSLPVKAADTITPGYFSQTIEAGKYLTGNQIISGSPYLLPENIRRGVSIFGVNGDYAGSGGGAHADTYSKSNQTVTSSLCEMSWTDSGVIGLILTHVRSASSWTGDMVLSYLVLPNEDGGYRVIVTSINGKSLLRNDNSGDWVSFSSGGAVLRFGSASEFNFNFDTVSGAYSYTLIKA